MVLEDDYNYLAYRFPKNVIPVRHTPAQKNTQTPELFRTFIIKVTQLLLLICFTIEEFIGALMVPPVAWWWPDIDFDLGHARLEWRSFGVQSFANNFGKTELRTRTPVPIHHFSPNLRTSGAKIENVTQEREKILVCLATR